jgi:DNA-directed RNA polymerase subunit M/transcription elongation factor TFIIS
MDRQKNIKNFSDLLNPILGKQIEESVYKFAKEYTDTNETPFLIDSVYSDKINEIICLLNNKKSNFLIEAIKNNKIDASKIATMRPDELNPNKYEKILKKKEVEDDKKKNQATSSNFKCPKCKEKKVIITQKQTRAADEPATIFIECKSCGHTHVHDDS